MGKERNWFNRYQHLQSTIEVSLALTSPKSVKCENNKHSMIFYTHPLRCTGGEILRNLRARMFKETCSMCVCDMEGDTPAITASPDNVHLLSKCLMDLNCLCSLWKSPL